MKVLFMMLISYALSILNEWNKAPAERERVCVYDKPNEKEKKKKIVIITLILP